MIRLLIEGFGRVLWCGKRRGCERGRPHRVTYLTFFCIFSAKPPPLQAMLRPSVAAAILLLACGVDAWTLPRVVPRRQSRPLVTDGSTAKREEVARAGAGGDGAPAQAAAVAAPAFAATANTALVFVKPHAVTPAACAAVREMLEARGCSVLQTLDIPSSVIEAEGLIDAHYGTLAELAMATDPRKLDLPDGVEASFKDTFGVAWAEAPLLRNGDALEQFG